MCSFLYRGVAEMKFINERSVTRERFFETPVIPGYVNTKFSVSCSTLRCG